MFHSPLKYHYGTQWFLDVDERKKLSATTFFDLKKTKNGMFYPGFFDAKSDGVCMQKRDFGSEKKIKLLKKNP